MSFILSFFSPQCDKFWVLTAFIVVTTGTPAACQWTECYWTAGRVDLHCYQSPFYYIFALFYLVNGDLLTLMWTANKIWTTSILTMYLFLLIVIVYIILFTNHVLHAFILITVVNIINYNFVISVYSTTNL